MLVQRYRTDLEMIAESILGRHSEAEDMVQDACIRAYTNLDLLVDESRFRPWLRRILFGCCIDFLRRQSRLEDSDVDRLIDRMHTGHQYDGSRHLASREVCDGIMEAIERLPALYRGPLKLFHLDGLRHQEVAHYLGIPEGSARSLVSRARGKLRSRLESIAGGLPEMTSIDKEVFATQSKGRGLIGALSERTLHITNGDSVAGILRESGVPGKIAVWADVLHEGPVDAELPVDAFIEGRARHLESMGLTTAGEAEERMGGWYRDLLSFPAYEEVILWFEHDLFDQLALIHHLAIFKDRDHGETHLSLICIGAYPGIKRFHGLGQLTPNQLASLLGTRRQLSHEDFDLGSAAWRAFAAPEPEPWLEFLEADTAALPFLAGAVRRHFQQYPSMHNGLGLSEQLALEGVDGGKDTAGAAFLEHQRREDPKFLGDGTFYHYLRRLAEGAHPLLRIEPPENGAYFGKARVFLTDEGRAVLAGETDTVALRGIDRWFGGVRVVGTQNVWRWDEASGTLRRR
jgi:RNA polymerase sigma factor (sigma-70 family)